jgi:hypothetical protein
MKGTPKLNQMNPVAGWGVVLMLASEEAFTPRPLALTVVTIALLTAAPALACDPAHTRLLKRQVEAQEDTARALQRQERELREENRLLDRQLLARAPPLSSYLRPNLCLTKIGVEENQESFLDFRHNPLPILWQEAHQAPQVAEQPLCLTLQFTQRLTILLGHRLLRPPLH